MKKQKKRKNPEDENAENTIEPVSDAAGDAIGTQITSPPNSGGHRAGYDAFMTGFAFSTFLVHQTQIPRNPGDFSPVSIRSEQLVNRIYLTCKVRTSFSPLNMPEIQFFSNLNKISRVCAIFIFQRFFLIKRQLICFKFLNNFVANATFCNKI